MPCPRNHGTVTLNTWAHISTYPKDHETMALNTWAHISACPKNHETMALNTWAHNMSQESWDHVLKHLGTYLNMSQES